MIASYNDHVRLLSPERSWLVTSKVCSSTGVDIVMESITRIESRGGFGCKAVALTTRQADA
jgi:hypothetical protein